MQWTGKAQQLSSYLLGSPGKDFPQGIFSLLCSQTFGVRFQVAIPLALLAAVGPSTVMSRVQDMKDWDIGMKLCERTRLGFPFCSCCQYLVNVNLAVPRLQQWSCKWFASSWDGVATLALNGTEGMQLVWGGSDPWLPKQKPQHVPLRLPAELLHVPALPSSQLLLQQHSCKFWLYPARELPLASPIPSVLKAWGWIQHGLQNQELSSQGIEPKLWNTDDSLRTVSSIPVILSTLWYCKTWHSPCLKNLTGAS